MYKGQEKVYYDYFVKMELGASDSREYMISPPARSKLRQAQAPGGSFSDSRNIECFTIFVGKTDAVSRILHWGKEMNT